MKVQLERIYGSNVDVAVVKCPEVLLNLFPGVRSHPGPSFSVIVTEGEIPGGDELALEAEGLQALVIGEPGYAILVGRRPLVVIHPDDKPKPEKPKQSGDMDFLRAAESQIVDPALRQVARELLAWVRTLQPGGSLQLGQGGKFVNYPDNFAGFTIQSRNQAVLLHVRESPASRHSSTVRPDRRPYVRFWVRGERDLVEARSLIQGSWQRGR